MTYISKRDQQREDWLFLFVILNACHWVGFFHEIGRNRAWVCSGWISVATAANWRSISGAAARRSNLPAVESEMERTCNLTLGDMLPPLSTGTAKINTKWKVPLSCFNVLKFSPLDNLHRQSKLMGGNTSSSCWPITVLGVSMWCLCSCHDLDMCLSFWGGLRQLWCSSSGRAATHDYFHYWLICWLCSQFFQVRLSSHHVQWKQL